MASLYFLFLVAFLLVFACLFCIFFILTFLVRPRRIKIPLKNRHVFISGGSSGIGLAMAKTAAAAGARVSILAQNQRKLEDARESIRLHAGIDVSIFSADVRNYERIREVFEEADPVDVLICNHGVVVAQELENMDVEHVKFMIDVNLIGTFHLIKAALPKMKKTDGNPRSITLLSSQAGQVGIYGYAAYSASKFGLLGLAQVLQQELIEDNIHLSLVFPPDTDTPGLAEENRLRPEITRILCGSSEMMKAEDVARKALNGIKDGTFIIPCNFEGFMMSIATAGMSPQRSSFIAFLEVIFTGLMRFVALGYQCNWYESIAKMKQASLSQNDK